MSTTSDQEIFPSSPESIWNRIDHQIVSRKLSLISQEMQPKFVSEERRASFEIRKRGNAGARAPILVHTHAKLIEEWLERVYEAYTDVWNLQGNKKSAGFIRAVFEKAIVPMISIRQGVSLKRFDLIATRTRSPSLSATAKNALVQVLERLRAKWRDKLETEAGACKYAEQQPAGGLLQEPQAQQSIMQTAPMLSVSENQVRSAHAGLATPDYISVWDQIDRRLVMLKLREPMNQHVKDIVEERHSIEWKNRGKRHTYVSATLEMVERRADEWINLAYGIYCEVWQLQGHAKSPNFLRTLRDNIIEPAVRARTSGEIHHFVSMWKNCGYPAPKYSIRDWLHFV